MRRDWWLISDVDGTLTGDVKALAKLRGLLEADRGRLGFGLATGRSAVLADEAVKEFRLPQPDLLICSVGSEIRAPGITTGSAPGEWPGPLASDWQPGRIRELLGRLDDLEPQSEAGQDRYKLGYLADADAAADAARQLELEGLAASVIHSAGSYLDVMPRGVDKGSATRFVAARYGAPLDRVVVAGDSGNDRHLLTCGAHGILVANHTSEVSGLAGHPRIHAASRPFAGGVLEGLERLGVWDG